MSHVLSAARSEYAKLEKALTDAEVAGGSRSMLKRDQPGICVVVVGSGD
jgi:hypothetical protein